MLGSVTAACVRLSTSDTTDTNCSGHCRRENVRECDYRVTMDAAMVHTHERMAPHEDSPKTATPISVSDHNSGACAGAYTLKHIFISILVFAFLASCVLKLFFFYFLFFYLFSFSDYTANLDIRH